MIRIQRVNCPDVRFDVSGNQSGVFERFAARFVELVAEGKRIQSGDHQSDWGRYIRDQDLVPFQAWVLSSANAITAVTRANTHYRTELQKIVDQKRQLGTAPYIIPELLGLLESVVAEAKGGRLIEIENVVIAETFDNFLDHADDLAKRKDKNGAAVLASAVFEDSLKKVAIKHSINEKRTLEPIINELQSMGVLTPLKSKKLKGFVGVRDKAFHANWDDFDANDVDQLIQVTREVIADYVEK